MVTMENSVFLQHIPVDEKYGVQLNIFRLDLLHPVIQGNKYFKLLYNLEFAIQEKKAIVTMGGPYSNHLYACALACNSEHIPCYGIIRGTNFKYLSPTLQRSKDLGMQLIFTERDLFRNIREQESIEAFFTMLETDELKLPKEHHFIPEGGSNAFGIQGAQEILENIAPEYDYVFVPVGTGGTISGIIRYLKGEKTVVGVSSVNDEDLVNKIKTFTENQFDNWQLSFNYHFGGYAKWNSALIDFINQFKKEHQVPLCPIYTGKMMFAIYDLLEKNYFPKESSILAIHTGGIQGIEGFNQVNKNILI
jgi:1-aminocyclopropane-1-carboxylate deaminase